MMFRDSVDVTWLGTCSYVGMYLACVETDAGVRISGVRMGGGRADKRAAGSVGGGRAGTGVHARVHRPVRVCRRGEAEACVY